MSAYLPAFLIGVVAGLRSLTAPAAISWAARLGWLHLENTWLRFMGATITPYLLSIAAVGEIINDKMPKTPSRKAPPSFAFRIVMGAICGWAFAGVGGAVAGVLGAIAGTMGGYQARIWTANAIGGKDLPIALIEDFIAIASAFLIISRP